MDVKKELRLFLETKGRYLETQQHFILGYWMVEYMGLNKDTTKEQLDSIIEPKLKLSQGYIWQRIKESLELKWSKILSQTYE